MEEREQELLVLSLPRGSMFVEDLMFNFVYLLFAAARK